MKSKPLFIVAAFFLLLLLVLTYSNHWSNSFHFDDFHTIVDNPHIRSLDNTLSFFTDPQTATILPAVSSLRSLCTLSAAIDYKLGHGYNPFYFHLSSFLWYIIQLIFMFFLFQFLFDKVLKHDWNNWLALFGVGWYGLHTASAETINYISARSDLLSTALVIIALVAYVRAPFFRKSGLYLIPFILGALAKPTALMFGPLLFVYLLLFEENSFFKAGLKSLPAFFIALLFFQSIATAVSSFAKIYIPLFPYLISQAFVVLYYFKTFFLPFGLSADYDWRVLTSVLDLRFLIGLVFIITMLILAYYSARVKKYRPVAFGILWFFIALIPTSIVPLTEILNDHRVFFPFVGLMIAVCWSAGLLLYKYEQELKAKLFLRRLIVSVAIIILLANALGTRHRNRIWKDEESLWYDVTIKSPANGRGLMNYGVTQMNKGRYDVALNYFQAARLYVPQYARLYTNLGTLHGVMDNQPEAEKNFKIALAYDPTLYAAYYLYAKWLTGQGREEEAIPLLIKSIELSPGFLWDRHLLLSIYDSQKKNDLASAVARQTLEIDQSDAVAMQYLFSKGESLPARAKPTPEMYLNLSLTYHNQGLYRECISAAEEAIKLRPDYAEAYNNIGAAYNTMKQWDKAIIALEKALAIKPDFQLAKNNLDLAKSQQ
ncbi:tetratricopeptide repeat protein [Candidatus Margulisiibacteriota bacterium]